MFKTQSANYSVMKKQQATHYIHNSSQNILWVKTPAAVEDKYFTSTTTVIEWRPLARRLGSHGVVYSGPSWSPVAGGRGRPSSHTRTDLTP